jgi:hypothetical protein
MKKTRSLVWLGATALLFGCSAGVKPTQLGNAGTTGTGAGGNSAGGTSGGGNSAGGTGGSAPFDASFDINTSDKPSDGVCSTTMTAAEPVPLDLYVLMDSSKSMNDPTSAGPSKWTAVTSAMNMFFADQAANGLGIALKYFPQEQNIAATCEMDSQCGTFGPCDFRLACVGNNVSAAVDTSSTLCPTSTTACPTTTQTCQRIRDCGAGASPCVQQGTGTCGTGCTPFTGYCHARDICTASSYATPDVPIATLPGAAAALMTSLAGHSPGGYTPTGPALGGALMFARSRIAAMPTHRVAVVLVTDGLPGGFIPGFPPAECMPTSIPAMGSDPGIAALLRGAMGTGGTPAVNTFVIGVFSPGAAAQMAQTNLDMLATAGGTAPAVIIDTSQDVSAALRNALKQVQSKAIACDYQLPTGGVDFKKVNVQFTSGSNQVTAILHSPPDGAGGCDARGGWYYDKDPATGTPTKITACPVSCSMFQTDLNGHVDVILGCPTIDVD